MDAQARKIKENHKLQGLNPHGLDGVTTSLHFPASIGNFVSLMSG